MRRKVTREEVLCRLRDAAFGRTNDILRLALAGEDRSTEDIDRLELDLVSEIKVAANGGLEIKLSSRTEMLRLLLEELSRGAGGIDGAKSFFEAMENASGGAAEEG